MQTPTDTRAVTTAMARLRAETRPHHERVERRVPLMDPALPLARYRGVLERFHGFYAPAEQRLEAVAGWAALGLDPVARRKTHRLRRDLRDLGLPEAEIDALPECRRLPALGDLPRALGCMYVLEGATLGGALIGRQLQRSLGLTPRRGAAFFASYGERRAPMWKEFGAALDRYAASPTVQDAVVRSAAATFDAMEAWLAGAEG